MEKIKALLECNTIPSLNRVSGNNYSNSNFDIKINDLRYRLLAEECTKHKLKFIYDQTQIIEHSNKKYDLTENQKMISDLMWKHGYIVVPDHTLKEEISVSNLISMIKESNGDNFNQIKDYANKIII